MKHRQRHIEQQGITWEKNLQPKNNSEKTWNIFVKAAFLATGGDFENPTVDNLSEAVEFLAKRAISWKTPMEIISHNKEQVFKAIEILKKGT